MDYLILRLVASFTCGVLLSQSGSFIQISTRNILAGPSTLGFEGLSVLWILLAHSILVFSGFEAEWLVLAGLPVFGFIGYYLGSVAEKGKSLERILFLGLSFNLLVGAVFSLWQFLFLAFNLPFPVEVWFGNFRFATSFTVGALIIFEILVLILISGNWKNLRLYSLGPSIAAAHSSQGTRLYKFFFVVSLTSTFIVLALFGAFSFLGLILPLVARRLWFRKFDLKGEIYLGAVMNGLVFMIFDYLCYQFPIMGAEIPVGLLASVVGAVCLIGLIGASNKGADFLANAGK